MTEIEYAYILTVVVCDIEFTNVLGVHTCILLLSTTDVNIKTEKIHILMDNFHFSYLKFNVQ